MNLNYILDATKRQKETITNWATKAGKNPDEVIRWAESNFEKDADQLAAAKWYISGYNTDIFEQALYICSQKKLDPLKQNPEELVSDNADLKQKDRPLNPDDVLTDRQEDQDGNVTYAARDEDRETIRQIINTHYGKDSSPWCLLQGDSDGELTSQSADYWEHYSAYPKRIAFRNGKLLAFSAGTDRSVREWWDRQDRSFPFIPYNGKTWVGKSGDTFEITKGEVFRSSADKSLRSHVVNSYSENIEDTDTDVMYDKSDNSVRINGTTRPIDHEDDKYLYIDDGHLSAKVSKELLTLEGECIKYRNDGTIFWKRNFKNGRKEGWSFTYDRRGDLYCEAYYKNDKQDGPYIQYRPNGNVECKYTCKNGVRDGKYEEYYENGNPHCLCTYKNGEYDGKHVEYYDNGKPAFKCTYKVGNYHGLATWYFEEGGIHKQFTYKNGSRKGQFTIYYPSGQLKTEGTYSKDDLNGHIVEYYENGNIQKDCNYQDGWPVGTVTEYYENEQIREQYTKDGHGNRVGEYVSYYFNGQLNEKCTYSHDNHKSGSYESYYENGNPKKKCNYDENGNLDGDLVSFYESGNKQASAHFTDDLLNGEYITYREDGSVLSRRFFKNGDEVKS